MDDEEKEIVRCGVEFWVGAVFLLICAVGASAALGAHLAGHPVRSSGAFFFISVGAVGWFWLICNALRELKYLTKLRQLRGYYNGRN